jgi:uncharacterized membrane protein
MNAELLKSKTFWTAIIGVLTTVAAVLTGQMTKADAIMPILTALVGIFLKDGLLSQTKTLQS